MNRQTKQLLALAGVLAVGAGRLRRPAGLERGEEEREAAQADYVLQLSDVTALSFDSGDGPLSFTLEETGWTWDGDSEFPVNGTELDALREDLAALKAERIIPEPDALADYGLEEPAYTLTARTDSGGVHHPASGQPGPWGQPPVRHARRGDGGLHGGRAPSPPPWTANCWT